jgi:hypothetical protein
MLKLTNIFISVIQKKISMSMLLEIQCESIIYLTGRILNVDLPLNLVVFPIAFDSLSRRDCYRSFSVEFIAKKAPCVNIAIVKIKSSIYFDTMMVFSSICYKDYMNLAPLG